MMPVLFELKLSGFDIALPTYGLILACAFLLALWVAVRRGRRAGLDPSLVTDLWIASLLAGVLGSKLLLYMLDLRYYLEHPRAILESLRSAGVFYGGLIAAIVVCIVIVRRRGADAWVVGDVLAPAIILGQAVGRLGCFAAGCCYGTSCTLPWAVTYTDPRAQGYTGVPLHQALHPVQIYLALADVAIFLVLLAADRRRKFSGQIFLLYLILYAAARATLEIFRGDPRGALWGLSTSQLIGIVVGLTALALYVRRSRESGAASRAARPGTKRPAPAG